LEVEFRLREVFQCGRQFGEGHSLG
jgi:hypothetical protein